MRAATHRRFWLRRLWWLAALLVYALLPFAPAPAPVAADSLVRAEAAQRAQPLLAPANVAAQQAAPVPLKTVWNSPQPDRSYSAAWGDLDNDGDLDLALGNYDAPNQVYRNCFFRQVNDGCAPGDQLLSGQPAWTAPITMSTQSLAWGDVDNDGDLDLVVGNRNASNQLYRNTNGQLALDRSWAPEPTTTYRVAWGDVDGDGDLDLATANEDEPHRLYRNQKGQLQLDPMWSPPSDRSYDLAWGDIDSDGDLDLAVANTGNLNDNVVTIYNNGRNVPQRKGATPSVRVLRPAPPADGGFGSAPRIFDQPTLTFTYTLRHPSAWPVQRVIGQYSLDGGGCWRPAVEAGAIMTGTQGLAIDSCVAAIPAPTAPLSATLPTSSDGISYSFTWDLFASGVFGQSDNVLFRLIAIPAVVAPDGLPGPLWHTASTATTNPFRVRGAQVQIRTATGPAADALVFRLPRGQSSGAQPFADATGPLLRSDLQGVLPGRGTLALGDQLTALVPISATETYTLYHSNATPTLTGTEAFTLRQPGVQTLDVSAANPLLLLNLVVSLEWDASQEPQFLAQLDNDLRRASELLFDWSDGQVALGELTLYQAKQQWDHAHIRIYATNRMRPNAVKGGIVSETSTDPITQTVTYGPGQVRIGAVWNRYGDPAGALGEDWPRTLAHELGHYALFLDDNYLGLDEQGLLVPVTTCAGTAMADPYRDDYSEFHPDAGWLPACGKTLSQRETGRSDWATINSFYPALHTPDERASGPNPGPNLLPLAVTRVRIVDPAADVQRAPLAAPIFLLAREDGSRYPPSEGARAFLFRRDEPNGAAVDIVDLGRPTLDRVLARGARPGDRVCVFDLGARRPDGTTRVAEPRLGCEEQVSPSDQQLTLARVDWQPDLSVTPVTSTTLAVRIGNLPAGLTLTARLYPSFGSTTAPGLTQPLQPAEPGVYRGSFTLDGPAFAGYLHLWVENEQPRREIVSGLTLIGSPGAGWGRGAPRGNPGAGWGRGAPVVSSDGQVLLYSKETAFATDQAITIQATDSAPSPLSWATLIGQAYRVASSAPALAGVSISFSYLGREVPDGEESGLRVYRWDALGQRWEVLPTALNLAQNNASALLDGPGLYALMSSIVLPIEHAGWNLVAYPAPEQPMPAALGSITGFYTTVYGYDPGNPTDPWQVYDAGVPAEWAPLVNDLRTLRYGQGYWINATQPITALLQGRPATIVLNATSGISSPPATYYGLAPAGVPAGTAVSARMGGTLCGETRTDTLTLDGQERVVFVIHVRSAGEGEDTGCGTPGRVVALVFGAGTATGGTLTAHWDNSRVHRLFEGAGRLYLPLVRP